MNEPALIVGLLALIPITILGISLAIQAHDLKHTTQRYENAFYISCKGYRAEENKYGERHWRDAEGNKWSLEKAVKRERYRDELTELKLPVETGQYQLGDFAKDAQ